MSSGLVVVIVVVVILVVLGLVFAGLYNGLVKLRNVVQESWAQIDVELKRRHDLIGNLVETVKGYASHERGTLDEVTRARAAAMAPNQGPAQAAQSEGELTRALVNLQAVSEAYPDLKANQNFMALQGELDLHRGPHRRPLAATTTPTSARSTPRSRRCRRTSSPAWPG